MIVTCFRLLSQHPEAFRTHLLLLLLLLSTSPRHRPRHHVTHGTPHPTAPPHRRGPASSSPAWDRATDWLEGARELTDCEEFGLRRGAKYGFAHGIGDGPDPTEDRPLFSENKRSPPGVCLKGLRDLAAPEDMGKRKTSKRREQLKTNQLFVST